MELVWTRLGCVVRSDGIPLRLEGPEEKQLQEVEVRLMWTEATLVFLGSLWYDRKSTT